MQSARPGVRSGCSGSRFSAAAPTPRETSGDADAAAACAAVVSADIIMPHHTVS